ncbi:unnamed protein product [Rhodiola kirilowii]
MGSPENNRSGSSKREVEDSSDMRGERARDDDEDWEGSERRKHRSSKLRKSSGGGEDIEGEGSGRRKSSGERSESRKRSSGSKYSDEDEYDVRRERDRSKQSRKSKEESSLEKLSTWYQDGEWDKDGVDKSVSRGHGRGDETDLRKSSSAFSENDKSLGKEDVPYEKDGSGNIIRRESSRERGQGSSETNRSHKKRWDEKDSGRRGEEGSREYGDERNTNHSDSKLDSTKEKKESYKDDRVDRKTKVPYGYYDKAESREEIRDGSERTKSKGRSEEEDYKASPRQREEKPSKDRNEKYRQYSASASMDDLGTQERPSDVVDDVTTTPKEKISKGVRRSSRSRTPERGERHHSTTDISDVERERSYSSKPREGDRDYYVDDRSRGRDDGYKDRSRDHRDSPGDSWKRSSDPKGGDTVYSSHSRERDFQRLGRDRNESDRHHSRSSGNVIEIQTKPVDYERGESGVTPARKTDAEHPSSSKSTPNVDDWAYGREDRGRRSNMPRHPQASDDSKEKYPDDVTSAQDQALWQEGDDSLGGKGRGQKGSMPGRNAGGQSTTSGSQPPYGNQDSNRMVSQGGKGNRPGGGRPSGRDGHQGGFPPPMMGSPFGPLGMPPPGSMQSMNPGMSPAPGPPMSPFIPPFSPPVIWPGGRGMEMNMLGGISPHPLGQSGPRFPLNMGAPPNPAMFFNQLGSGRGMPPNLSGPAFNNMVPGGLGAPHDGNWVPPKTSGPPGKAPSRGEQNDYSQNFVDTGMRPQNFIRELELTNVVEDYPKLRELIQKKDEIVSNSSAPPMYYKCDLREHVLSPEFFGTKFDVILIDPPWEEYVHRAPGVADNMEYWTLEEIMNLKIEAIADTPSFIFLWVGDGVGLEQGRQCLKKWGFRRCEDICWVKTNKNNATPGMRHDSRTLFQRSKEHCLMGIKGTVRRSTDGHIIHANIDTDVIIAEEPPYGSTEKPEDMYRIIEHFCLGRRRLELFGEDHNIRAGWLTLGNGLTSSNFHAEAFIKNFADKDGKSWQGGGGRNPPPDAPHLVKTTPDIEALRPKSPMKNQQQLQQQSSSISINTANSSNKRPAGGNMFTDSIAIGMVPQEVAGQMNPGPWPPAMDGFKGGGTMY